MENALLIAGLIFPAISWLSFLASGIQYLLAKKTSSGVYIPFIGPLLIDIWIIAVDAPIWTLVIPWIADIGTVFFLFAMPRLIVNAWQTSQFTRIFLLVGMRANQAVEISFHKGGHYVLKKNWNRPTGEMGVVALSEPGSFEEVEESIVLTSHTGAMRHVRRHDGEYLVSDTEAGEDYNLDGWTLHEQNA